MCRYVNSLFFFYFTDQNVSLLSSYVNREVRENSSYRYSSTCCSKVMFFWLEFGYIFSLEMRHPTQDCKKVLKVFEREEFFKIYSNRIKFLKNKQTSEYSLCSTFSKPLGTIHIKEREVLLHHFFIYYLVNGKKPCICLVLYTK